MQLHEDDRKAIIDVVNAAILQHKSDCPMAASISDHRRIMIDLYNGDDGESGLVAEFRTFLATWKARNQDADKRRSTNWKIAGAVGVLFMGLCGFFGPKVWNLVVDDIRLTEEWKTYQPAQPQSQPVPYTDQQPQPKIQHKSFFQHTPHGVSSRQAPPPTDAGLPSSYDSSQVR